jgi:predicted nuclease of predicted toxin-antitoxin system
VNFWVDAQLSPSLAGWLRERFGVDPASLRDLGLRDAKDRIIFSRARDAGAVVITKDSDFVELLQQLGQPPQVLWITLGNTSNQQVRSALSRNWPRIVELFLRGEPLVEVGG